MKILVNLIKTLFLFKKFSLKILYIIKFSNLNFCQSQFFTYHLTIIRSSCTIVRFFVYHLTIIIRFSDSSIFSISPHHHQILCVLSHYHQILSVSPHHISTYHLTIMRFLPHHHQILCISPWTMPLVKLIKIILIKYINQKIANLLFNLIP